MTTQGTIDEATSELLNDDGAKVAPGRGDCAHLFYCGRVNNACSTLDRRCKTQRSQCASCERFQRTPAAIAAMKDVQKTPAPATVVALPTDADKRALVQRCLKKGWNNTDEVLHNSSVRGPLETRATLRERNWAPQICLDMSTEDFEKKFEKCFRVDIEYSYSEEYQGYVTGGRGREKGLGSRRSRRAGG